jgi:methionyl aminopeptidase
MASRPAEIITGQALEKMRAAAAVAVQAFEMISPHVKVGVTTEALNEICHRFLVDEMKVTPAPLTKGFPKAICTSPNRVVCHGVPNDKPLRDGDILNIDISLEKDGYFADTCRMYLIGKNVSVQAKRIVQCAQECLYVGIALVKPGVSLRTIGRAIEKKARAYGYSVVREFCGHGIGSSLHQAPQVLHYDDPRGDDDVLKPGMTFTIEPMVNVGKADIKVLPDKWTVVTRDQSLSAQYEHTLLVTDTGVEVLTLRPEESMDAIMAFAG